MDWKIQFFVLSMMYIKFCASDSNNLGPADITVERIEECENPEQYPHEMPIRMNKINRTHVGYTGCINMPHDMDNNTAFNLTMAKWGDGGWKPNALNVYQINICEVLNKNVRLPWDGVMKAAGRKDSSCPIEKEKYCVNKYTVNLEGLFPSMLYGKFRADIIFIWFNSPHMCIRFYITSVPTKGGFSPSGPPKGDYNPSDPPKSIPYGG